LTGGLEKPGGENQSLRANDGTNFDDFFSNHRNLDESTHRPKDSHSHAKVLIPIEVQTDIYSLIANNFQYNDPDQNSQLITGIYP
jgi:hypothetical protein